MDGEVAVALDLISTWIGHTSDSEARHWVARAILVAFPNRLLKFTQPSTPAEQREKMTASPDEQ